MSRYHAAAGRLSVRYDSGFGTVDYMCDSCGIRIDSRTLPAGWSADGAAHRCPACAGQAAAEADAAPAAGRMDDEFTAAYVVAALWSSTDDDGDPLDASHRPEDIDPGTMRRMRADCAKFQRENADDIDSGGPAHGYSSRERAGHDFWLTRNGHGAGFWDGDWPEPAATRLTAAAKAFGESDLIVDDGGAITDGRG